MLYWLHHLKGGREVGQKPETESRPRRKGHDAGDTGGGCRRIAQTVNAIEKGEYNPTINLCRSICKVLGKTLDDLFWEE